MPLNKTQTKKRRIAVINALLLLASIVVFIGVAIYRENEYEPPKPTSSPAADAVYRQADQPIDARVKDLLDRMTIEEKIGQMAVVDKNSLKRPEDVSIYGLGGVLSGAGAKPEDNTASGWLEMVGAVKQEALQTRLGIPLLFGVDATHGHGNVPGATVFPHAIGLGASGSPELVRIVAEATSQELNATGVNWNYAPVLDAPEDIRWGRTYESFSSDPELNARLGNAYIVGAQNSDDQVLSSAKHFLGLGSMKWGGSNNKDFEIDQGRIEANDAKLDEYLAPFKAAVDADVSSIMGGLTDYGDTRIIDNKFLITDKLKNELGFKGIVVSDWFGLYEYSGVGRYDANVKTVNAGIDMAMLPFDYKIFMKDMVKAVEKGDISPARIDDAVSRILTQKFKAGLFEPKVSADIENVGSPEHRSLARDAVAESAVLLKNDNGVLPISKSTNHIRVAGSGANNIGRQAGAWTVEWQGIDGNQLPGATSILDGMKQTTGLGNIEYDEEGYFADTGIKADVGIAIVSEKPYAEGWGDNGNPTLSVEDTAAIQRLRENSVRIVIVTISGRPLLMSEEINTADAVVAAWLPGSEGGGVADVLFGDKLFTGRLPIDWLNSLSQLPILTNGSTSDGTEPQYRRGFGL